MLSSHVLETFRPLVARMPPAQRLELIRWIVNEAPPVEESTLETPDTEDAWAARISAEAAAWYARPIADRAPYAGHYVAVHKAHVVDHDSDRRTLAIRIRQRYPATPVLITAAEARQPQEFLILSPRLEREDGAHG